MASFRISNTVASGASIDLKAGHTTAATPTGSTIVPQVADGSISVSGCQSPPAPIAVNATDGTYGDRVRVSWSLVANATAYRVYRNSTDNSASATVISPAVITSQFDDLTAAAPVVSGSGCSATPTVVRYYYWVRATNDCGMSPFSATDQGYRGSAKSAGLYEATLPSKSVSGAVPVAGPDGTFAIRLRADEAIDPASIWGSVGGINLEGDALQWVAADESGQDGWVVCTPQAALSPGAVVEVIVGAATEAGLAVGPLSQAFGVEFQAAKSAAATGIVGQPDYVDFDTAGMDLTQEANDEVLVSGTTEYATYLVGPEGVFTTPQRIWLPVPRGYKAEDLRLQYFHQGAGSGKWYEAGDVEGWLVLGSDLQLDLDGQTYLGYVVRHSGKIRLAGATMPSAQASMVPMPSSVFGDVLLGGLVVLTLLFAGRRRARAKA